MTNRKKTVAVFHPRMDFGGSEAFAMWTLRALKRDYQVALVAGGRIDLPRLNAFYGTSVGPDECETVELPLPWPLADAEWGAALRGALISRSMRRQFDRFDVLISAYNIADFGRPGIHHLADFSWDENLRRSLDPPPPGPRKLLHVIPPVRRAYLALAQAIAGGPAKDDRRDAGLVLANSEWSREILRKRHGIESRVLYPPLPLPFMPAAAERKIRRFVSLGRIYPEKRIERMVEILKAVRARGHDVSLHVIGDTRESAYGRQVERLCRAEGRWIVLEGRQFGEVKMRLLAESAFGIHARQGEAFGIAIAEMITAGCLPFVPSYGGPAEILGHHPALIYDTPEEAVDKIDALLRNRGFESEVRAFIARRAQRFAPETFMRGMRRVVAEFAESQCARTSMAVGR